MKPSEDIWKARSDLYKAMWKDVPGGSTTEERMRNILNFYIEDGRFDARILNDARVVSVDAETNQVVFELIVKPYLCSKMKALHGGAACTILDMMTTACLMLTARPGFLDMGSASRTISMTYVRPVQEGQTVRIECRIVDSGARFANVYGEIKSLDGKIAVTCAHDKAVAPSPNL
jgi:acyl-coenzyme A thioesterase 13